MRIESWHRHHAVHLASHLPERIDDARTILRLVHELVEGFLAADPEPERSIDRANVVTLVKEDGR
jgi:hypothetical protein